MSVHSSDGGNQELFFSNSEDSPYNNCVFDCKYVNISKFKNLNRKHDFQVMTINIQSLNAKFNERTFGLPHLHILIPLM